MKTVVRTLILGLVLLVWCSCSKTDDAPLVWGERWERFKTPKNTPLNIFDFLLLILVPCANNLDVDVSGVEAVQDGDVVDQVFRCSVEDFSGGKRWTEVEPVVDVGVTELLETLDDLNTSDDNLGIDAFCWVSSIHALGDSTPAEVALLSQSCDAGFFCRRTKITVTSKNQFGDLLVKVLWRLLS